MAKSKSKKKNAGSVVANRKADMEARHIAGMINADMRKENAGLKADLETTNRFLAEATDNLANAVREVEELQKQLEWLARKKETATAKEG